MKKLLLIIVAILSIVTFANAQITTTAVDSTQYIDFKYGLVIDKN